MKYIYIMKRRGNGVRLALALPTFDAEHIEAATFDTFSRYRITISPRRREKLFRQHIKVGITNSPKTRAQQVDCNIFASGRTEWLAGGPLMRLRVWCYVWCYVLWSWAWRALMVFGLALGLASLMAQ